MKSAVDVSLVIVNWNAEQLLRKCLLSLPKALANLSHEVIVIDNASSDDSAEMLRTEFPTVQLILNQHNEGLGKANDIGFRASTGNTVAFCNPDIEPAPGSLETLVEFLRRKPRAGMAGGLIETPNGDRDRNAIRDIGLRSVVARTLNVLRGRSTKTSRLRDDGDTEGVVRCFTVHGCCMVCTRAAIEKIGGFPTTTFLYGEEMLVGSLLKRAGYEVWWHPGAKILHHTGSSVNQRWSWVERNRVRRSGIIEAVRATRSWLYFQVWNLGKLVQSVVRLLAARGKEPRRLARTLIGLHLRTIIGLGGPRQIRTEPPE